GDQRRQADAQVHIGAFGNVACHPRGDLVAIVSIHKDGSRDWRQIRLLTKMPGVTTASGSSSPSSQTRPTEAMVWRAAMAITGPKLRAVLRYTRLPQRSPASALIRA